MCKLTKYMSKFHISTQILQGNALFSGKNYTTGNNFTRPPVATVTTNFKSDHDPGMRHKKMESKTKKGKLMMAAL